jgi:hypothetical protein
MSIKIIKDGQVVHDDKKPSVEELIEQQNKVIQDLQNQIKDLKKQKTKK